MKPHESYASKVTGDPDKNGSLRFIAGCAVAVLAIMFLMDETGYRRGRDYGLSQCVVQQITHQEIEHEAEGNRAAPTKHIIEVLSLQPTTR